MARSRMRYAPRRSYPRSRMVSYAPRARRSYARARSAYRRARSHKPSLFDYASMFPGVVSTYNEMGSVQAMVADPAYTYASLSANYFGYNPQTGGFDFWRAWNHQWKPFLAIQGGKYLITKFFPRTKNWKLPFLNVKIFG